MFLVKILEVFWRCSGGWQSAGPMSLAKASDNGRLKDWANWSRLKRSPTICFFSSFLIISSHHIVKMFSPFWDLSWVCWFGCISCLWLFEWGCATVQHEKISSEMEVARRDKMFTHSVYTAYTVYTAFIFFTAHTVFKNRLLCPCTYNRAYIDLWALSKMLEWSGWLGGWLNTPQTALTTRAPFETIHNSLKT